MRVNEEQLIRVRQKCLEEGFLPTEVQVSNTFTTELSFGGPDEFRRDIISDGGEFVDLYVVSNNELDSYILAQRVLCPECYKSEQLFWHSGHGKKYCPLCGEFAENKRIEFSREDVSRSPKVDIDQVLSLGVVVTSVGGIFFHIMSMFQLIIANHSEMTAGSLFQGVGLILLLVSLALISILYARGKAYKL